MAPMTEQVNVRVPPDAKDIILRVARLLREDGTQIGKLDRYLAEMQETGLSPALTERINRLENQVAQLQADVKQARTPQGTPAVTPEQIDIERWHPAPDPEADPAPYDDRPHDLTGERVGPDPAWFNGKEGKARRLNDTGKAEVDRRLRAGHKDKQIADAMGVAPNTVTNRRKGLAATPSGEG